LFALIYIQLSLILEFQVSYYLNYYNFIDFSYNEGLKERYDYFYNVTNAIQKEFTKENNIVYTNNNSISKINSYLSYLKSKLLFYNIMFKVENYSKLSVITKQCITLTLEPDEYKHFFLSNLIYFSGNDKVISSLSEGLQKKIIYQSQSITIVFYIYLFYSNFIFVVYNFFCFFCPAYVKSARLKHFFIFNFIYSFHILLFLLLPYSVALYEEVIIESLDSELFYTGDFDLLNAGIIVFFAILLLSLIFFLIVLIKYY